MMNASTRSTSLAPLYWLALGTFAVGTESFMIAGLLPDMATDLHTSIVATGQLVTVFALAYALSSPILTALTGAFHRAHADDPVALGVHSGEHHCLGRPELLGIDG